MNKCLMLIVGPAGVGKTVVLTRALEEEMGFARLTSLTTRDPRPGEVDGVDYHFVDGREFEAMRDGGLLVEWTMYDGEFYGTPVSDIMDSGNAVKIVTNDGLLHTRAWLDRFWDNLEGGGTTLLCISILVLASTDDIERRLTERGCDAAKIGRAKQELLDLSQKRESFSSCISNEEGNIDLSATILRQWMRYGRERIEMMNEETKKGETKMGTTTLMDETGPMDRDGSIPFRMCPVSNIHEGSIKVRGNDNLRHIKVDSESNPGTSYYVSVDVEDGTVMGCTCPAASMDPTKRCKHQRVVVERRFLQI